jgi:hypothetical protein
MRHSACRYRVDRDVARPNFVKIAPYRPASANSRLHRRSLTLALSHLAIAVCLAILLVGSANGQDRDELIGEYNAALAKYTAPARLERLSDWYGDISWGSSWVLDSLVSMYEATRDEKYLETGSRMVGAIFAARDDKRNIRDYSGQITKFWSNKKYNLGRVEIKNQRGEVFLELGSIAFASANLTRVSVHKSGTGSLTVIAENRALKEREEYRDIPYQDLEKRINTVRKSNKLIWLQRFEPAMVHDFQEARDVPTEVLVYAWPTHHVGWVLAPVLRWCWVVQKSQAKAWLPSAQTFVALALETLTAKDLEDNYVRAGGSGYYRIPRGVPVWADGAIEPFNVTNSFARAFYFAWKLTGRAEHLERTRELVNWWKAGWRKSRAGALEWPYWVGPGAEGWDRRTAPGVNTQEWKGTPTASPTKYAAVDFALVADIVREGDTLVSRDDLVAVERLVARLLDDHCRLPWRIDGVGTDEFTQQSLYFIFRFRRSVKITQPTALPPTCVKVVAKLAKDVGSNATIMLTLADFLALN